MYGRFVRGEGLNEGVMKRERKRKRGLDVVEVGMERKVARRAAKAGLGFGVSESEVVAVGSGEAVDEEGPTTQTELKTERETKEQRREWRRLRKLRKVSGRDAEELEVMESGTKIGAEDSVGKKKKREKVRGKQWDEAHLKTGATLEDSLEKKKKRRKGDKC